METRVISLATDFDEAIRLGAELLARGELVAFPTETVYGLGADALSDAAVQRIFAAKGRPSDNPLIVHVAGVEEVAQLVTGIPPVAQRLMLQFWPGPLTIVLPKSQAVPPSVTAGLASVAVRMPRHEAALRLIQAAGKPIAAPSANASGRPSPTSAAHVLEDLRSRIPLLLDGGDTHYGVESTVAMPVDGGVRVLRPGGVTVEMLQSVVERVEVDAGVLAPLEAGEKAASPGMLHAHYAPKAEVLVVDGADELRAQAICGYYDSDTRSQKRIFCMEETRRFYHERRCVIMGGKQDVSGMCARLFALLREMDALNVEAVYIEGVDASGMGLALMNRMLRAAGFRRVNIR